MTQTTWDAWSDGTGPDREPEPEPRRTQVKTPARNNDYETAFTTLSCPWCLCHERHFREAPSGTGCPNCSALIPTDAEWYQRGEKVCL